MKRVVRKALEAVYFLLCFMPIPLLIGFALLDNGFALLAMTACVVPLAYVLSLLPGYVGGRRRHEDVTAVSQRRGGDPDPDRNLRRDTHEDEEKRRAFPLRAAVCAITFIGVALYLFIGPAGTLTDDWLKRIIVSLTPAVMLPMALIFCASGRSTDTKNVIAGVLLYAAGGIAALAIREQALDVCLALGGGGFMLTSLWLVNSEAMHTGAASRTGVKPPAAMRRHNRALLIGLMLAALLIAAFNWLKEQTERLFSWIASTLWAVFAAISRFFGGDQGSGGGMTGGDEAMDLSALGEGQEPSLFWEIMTYVAYVLAAVLVAVLLYVAVRKLAVLFKKLWAQLGAWMGRVGHAVGEDYRDERESLLNWGDVRRDMSDQVKKRLGALFAREKKWEQMDAREQARYLVRILYRRRHVPADDRTLREVLPDLNAPDPQTLAEVYEAARYAGREPEREQLERLRRDERA